MPETSTIRKRRASRPKDERIRVQTETGSIYEIVRDSHGMRWRRLSATLGSGPLRNDGAELLRWPEVQVGERCPLFSEPFIAPLPRLVLTSTVVAIVARSQSGEARAHNTPPRPSFREVGVGDRVTRLVGGSIPMVLVVTSVDDRFIYCGEEGAGWKFDRQSSAEVDEELGWGPGLTGSFLVHEGEAAT